MVRAPEICSRAMESTESRVTPGRIIPSSGGVTSSIAENRVSSVHYSYLKKHTITSTLVPQCHKHVHRAYLSEVVFRAMQPQVLRVSMYRGLLLRDDAWSVIGAELVCAGSAWVGTAVLGRAEERHRLEAGRVVRPNGRQDDEEERFVGWGDTDSGLSAN